MKIQLMSDLHLEFEPTFRPKNAGSDVLVLSGDICVADYFTRSEASPYHDRAMQFLDFFVHVTNEWDHVVYVAGNHENYHGYIDTTVQTLKNMLQFRNLHLLDKTSVDLSDVRFVGATLWTDLNAGNPITENYLRGAMNDFRLVQWKNDGYRKFTPLDSFKLHRETLREFDRLMTGHDKVVVVGHHAPSFKSVHPKYHNQDHMNGGYHSQLDNFILDHPQIKLWTHGHMHDCFDYEVGTTRVWCNPRGYNDENPYFNPEKVVEV